MNVPLFSTLRRERLGDGVPERLGERDVLVPHAIYRDAAKTCKHAVGFRQAYGQLDRERRLGDFLAGDPPADCAICGELLDGEQHIHSRCADYEQFLADREGGAA